jgi:hypothetical protein
MDTEEKFVIKLAASLIAGFIIIPLIAVSWFSCMFYQVEFTNGDSYYVRAEDLSLKGQEIYFKSFVWRRNVRGNDYRIIEPIFPGRRVLDISNLKEHK